MIRVKSVELIEQLEHRALHLSIACLLAVESFRSNGVQFVDEDYRRGFLFGQREGIADEFRSVA